MAFMLFVTVIERTGAGPCRGSDSRSGGAANERAGAKRPGKSILRRAQAIFDSFFRASCSSVLMRVW